LSLSSFAAILGQPVGRWPFLRIARTEFWGVGVIDGNIPYYDGDRRMSQGEEFDLGLALDTYYLVWSFGNIGMVKPDKQISAFGFEYSLGASKIEVQGVAYERYLSYAEIDYKDEGYGFGVMMKVRYGTMSITDSTNAYLQANGGALMTETGGMLQCGYELGILTRFSDNFVLRTCVGQFLQNYYQNSYLKIR